MKSQRVSFHKFRGFRAWLAASAAVSLLAIVPTRAGGDESPKQPSADPAAAAPLKITRADLATAYLRLEEAYFAHPPTGERMIAINQGFDQATLAFFMGRNGDAIRLIDGLTLSLRPQPATPALTVAASLKATITPPVWILGRPLKAVAHVQSIYPAPLDQATDVELQAKLVSGQGKTVFAAPLKLTAGPEKLIDLELPLEVPGDAVLTGVYSLELVDGEGAALTVARACAVAAPGLDAQRTTHQERLAKLSAASPALTEALATCKARNALLTDRPSETNSAQFLADMQQLASDVAHDITALESGQDPYRRRRGDYWRVLRGTSGEIPLRIYASERATTDEPAPLLVVLHGAGGDENMFLEAHGVGAIKRIADEKGLLIASPLTYRFGGPQNLDKLVDALSQDYAIDPERIYLLGHSMGAGAVAGLARNRVETIAAACCIAGGSFSGTAPSAPVLAVIAELDAVVPASLKTAADKAAAAGAPVEVRLMPGYGHTLVVGSALPDAVDWLLKHRRQPKAQK